MTEEPTEGLAEDLVPEDLDQKWVIPDDEDRSVYRFVLAAARRARQLQGGQRTAMKTTLRKPTKIAMEEIRCGAVRVEVVPEGQPMHTEEDFWNQDRYALDAMLAAGDGTWKPTEDRPDRMTGRPYWPPKR